MRILKGYSKSLIIEIIAISLFACKTKKLATTTEPTPPPAVEEKAVPPPPPAPEQKEEVAPVAEKPNFNFKNIQFEYNSSVLKTFSYSVLDQIAIEMKKYPSAKFNLNGHSSLEGSTAYNMSLSEDRASSVKVYLVNNGVDANNLITVGYGETAPIAENNTEAGRSLNRRVEIKPIN